MSGASDPGSGIGTVRDLARLLAGRRVTVLSGAGVSTESGIPDYRSPDGRRRPGASGPRRVVAAEAC